ncbi:MAG: tetratricopeptide repeat protein [Rhizomicrobium sp.]|jgi:tetratricopeptide (TPR) repeat protein
MLRTLLLAIAIAIATSASAQQTDRQQTTDQPPPDAPWVKAQAVLDATDPDARKNGYQGIASHVNDLEQALANGKASFAPPPPGNGPVFALADGPEESLYMMLKAASDQDAGAPKRDVHAVHNPYPEIALYLGDYYDEVGRFGDALRALDLGLSLTALPGKPLGKTRPYLLSERGAALSQLKRWDDALANYDDALKQAKMDDEVHARLLRGRGFVLTELNRLDDAEDSYNQSLKIEPGNPRALAELKYIASLRAGAAKAPSGGLTPIQPPKQ